MNEPVSWLLLERYALGELGERERVEVERKLQASDADRARLDAILADTSELPPLPVPLAPRRRRARRAAPWLAGLGLAAALALAVVRPPAGVPERREVSEGVKGGEVALVLHGERLGAEPSVFRNGDRFKLLVTCPSWLSSRWSVLMFQDGQRYQPLLPVSNFRCGNLVAWPGAFSLDGGDVVEVCVTWTTDLAKLDRARKSHDLEPEVVCQVVEPE
jgi:hypothetical protein